MFGLGASFIEEYRHMSKLLAALLIIGLVSFSIALADDADNDRVVRDEHVTRTTDNGAKSQPANHETAKPKDTAKPEDTAKSPDSAKPQDDEQGANLHAVQDNSNRQDDRDLPEVDRAQDFLDARAQMSERSHPDTLELDSLGLYFGLGENFVESANSLIEQRQAGYSERGNYPVFSRLSDGPLGDLSVSNSQDGAHAHQHGQDSASSDSSDDPEDQGLNRRGSDHDYFYD
jgi:hypothetical protein